MAEENLKDLASTNLKLKFILRNASHRLKAAFGREKDIRAAFREREEKGLDDIPVFIISYDRLSLLKKLINSLERLGITNIHIIDNDSTYPPLLEYYKNTRYDVIYVGENLGSRVFWKTDIFDKYRNDFYVITDFDLEMVDECPHDLIPFLFRTLEKYPFVRKVGVSLKIDDIPDDSVLGKEVKQWESQFFKAPINNGKAYYASVDTTFAIYLPDHLAEGIPFLRAIRAAYPYQARHLPWYTKEGEISEEEEYYAAHRSNGWWDVANGEITPD